MKSPYKKAKDRAWKAFSDYIRLRDCLQTTRSPNYCQCITCGKIHPYDYIQAGHFVEGRGNAVLFDEDIVNGQCKGCNHKHNYQAKVVYRRVMVSRFGEEEVKEMENLLWETKQYTKPDLDALTDYYKQKRKELL